MFCGRCGAKCPDSAGFCPECGNPIYNSQAGSNFNNGGNKSHVSSVEAAVDNTVHSVAGAMQPQYADRGSKIRTDRDLVSYILLTIVTCGIYAYLYIYEIAQDVNTICEGDNEETPSLVVFIVLSIITCGFYGYWWDYKIANRIAANGPRYGVTFTEDGTTILLWDVIGLLLCGLGPYIAMYILIKNLNTLADAYNRSKGFI